MERLVVRFKLLQLCPLPPGRRPHGKFERLVGPQRLPTRGGKDEHVFRR